MNPSYHLLQEIKLTEVVTAVSGMFLKEALKNAAAVT
uniref:Bm3820 n=1 Tax=Parascaris univalens TaxID=6257 RepID=A0A915BXH7_PARUN